MCSQEVETKKKRALRVQKLNQEKNERIHFQRISTFMTVSIVLLSFMYKSYDTLSSNLKIFLLFLNLLSFFLTVNECRLRKKLLNFPNVILGLPYFGELFHVLPPNSFYERIYYWQKIAFHNDVIDGEPFTIYILDRPMLVVSNEEDLLWLCQIERKGYTKVAVPEAMRVLFGETSLMLTEGMHHKILRRIMEPIFAQGSLENYIQIMDNLVLKQLQEWESLDPSKEKWVSTRGFKMLTLEILLCSIFGDLSSDTIQEFHDLLVTWWAGATKLAFAIPGTTFYKSLVAKRQIQDKIGKLIEDFKQNYPETHPKVKTALIGRLVYAKDENETFLGKDELAENILIILFAGHDSTYASIGNFMYYFIRLSPSIQKALLEEVRHHINEPLNIQELKNDTPILNAFLAETWRSRAPVVGGAREVTTDEVVLYKNNCVLPKRSGIYYSSFIGHEEYYGSNANKFQLERWLPHDHPIKKTTDTNDMLKDYNQISRAFRTFGIGKHACLGHYFAKLEARIIMVRILQKYHVDVKDSHLVTQPFVFYESEFKLTPL